MCPLSIVLYTVLHKPLSVFQLYEEKKKQTDSELKCFCIYQGESAHKGTFIRGYCSSAEEGSIPRSIHKQMMILSRKPSSVISSACSCQVSSLAFQCPVCLWWRERGSTAVPPTSSWDEEPAHTGCVQCCSIIGNHVCHCGLSMWECSLQYSSHRELQGRLFSYTGFLWVLDFFSCIFASASTPGLPQHMEVVTNLLNYSKMENYWEKQ